MKQTKSSNNIGIVETNSPFISQRTLRKYAQLQRRAPPPPPAPAPVKKVVTKRKPKAIDNAPFGGMYSKATGLVRGPPTAAGVPLFYFDPFAPPNFTEGTYGTTVTKVVEVKEVEAPAAAPQQSQPASKSSLAAPPLPPYVTGKTEAAAPKADAAPKKLVINKVKKDTPKEEPKATGWQAVMAEMARRKNGGLKAAPKPEEAKPPPPKKEEKKKKKGGKGFKDVMDELAYKLAVRRGEIVEEDDDEDEPAEESKAPAPAKTETKETKQEDKAEKKEESKPTSEEKKDDAAAPGPKKLPARPDLAAMLSKVLPKGDAKPAAAEGKEASAGPKKLPAKPDLAAMLSKVLPKGGGGGEEKKPSAAAPAAPSGGGGGGSEKGEIAVARPAAVPAPPPIPSSWPPKPHTAPYKPSTSSAAAKPAPATSSAPPPTSTPVPAKPASKPQTITTTAKATQPLPEGYYLASSRPGQVEACGILSEGVITEAFLADLTQQFTEEEEVPVVTISLEQELAAVAPVDMARYSSLSETLQIPNKLSLTDLPVPPNYVATVERLKKAADMRVQANAFQQRLELRNYDYEHDHDNGDYMCKATLFKPTNPKDVKFFTDKHFENKARTFRKEKEKSEADSLPMSARIESKVTQRNYVYGENLDVPTAYFFNSLRSSSTTPALGSSQKSQFSDGHSAPAHRHSQHESQQQFIYQTPSTPTEPKAPRFRSEEALQKRQQEKEMRMFYSQQNDEWQKQQTKEYKEYLKEKALQTAKVAGVYQPTARRNRTHQRMIQKYSNRPDVGVDLAAMTSQARENYYQSTNSSFATDGSQRTHSAWEYLENESLYTTPYASSRNPYSYHYSTSQMDIDELLLEEYS